jgi:DNA-binding NarL/FixJ family response regulator
MVDGLGLLSNELKRNLNAQPDLEVVRSTDTVAGAIEHPEGVRPDVVVMDFMVTGGTGAAAARLLNKRYPDAAVVLMWGEHPGNLPLAEFVVASAFVPITCAPASVVDIVREVARPTRQASPRIQPEADGSKPRGGSTADTAATDRLLTAREQRLLQLIALGMTSRAIAKELGLSVSTARTYTQRLLEKLDAHSKTEAVRKAIRQGLIEP